MDLFATLPIELLPAQFSTVLARLSTTCRWLRDQIHAPRSLCANHLAVKGSGAWLLLDPLCDRLDAYWRAVQLGATALCTLLRPLVADPETYDLDAAPLNRWPRMKILRRLAAADNAFVARVLADPTVDLTTLLEYHLPSSVVQQIIAAPRLDLRADGGATLRRLCQSESGDMLLRRLVEAGHIPLGYKRHALLRWSAHSGAQVFFNWYALHETTPTSTVMRNDLAAFDYYFFRYREFTDDWLRDVLVSLCAEAHRYDLLPVVLPTCLRGLYKVGYKAALFTLIGTYRDEPYIDAALDTLPATDVFPYEDAHDWKVATLTYQLAALQLQKNGLENELTAINGVLGWRE